MEERKTYHNVTSYVLSQTLTQIMADPNNMHCPQGTEKKCLKLRDNSPGPCNSSGAGAGCKSDSYSKVHIPYTTMLCSSRE